MSAVSEKLCATRLRVGPEVTLVDAASSVALTGQLFSLESVEMSKLLERHRLDILRIAATHGARHIRVFGSFARGEEGPDSDLDVLVDLEPGRDLLDIVAVKQDLEALLGCKVDVVTERAVSPYIRESVLKEAATL